MIPRSASDELGDLLARSVAPVADLLDRLALAIARDDEPEAGRAERALGAMLARSEALADLLGRRRLLLEADAAASAHPTPAVQAVTYAAARGQPRSATPVVPDLPFAEAFRDLLEREPRLARSAAEVAKVYSRDHGFALARSARLALTKRVQAALQVALLRGDPPEQAIARLAQLGLGRGYAATVYRTNVATAYTAGRFRQAALPEVADVLVGFVLETAGDADVRPNHAAADGYAAARDDPAWDRLAPPLGFNCRCVLRPLDRYEAERRGLLRKDGTLRRHRPPVGAGPDPGFARYGRPDRTLYGGR